METGVCRRTWGRKGLVFVHRRVDEGMRTQAQALLTLFTGGIAGLVGIPFVEWLHRLIVPTQGWSAYWLLLTGINVIAMTIFAIGYRRLPVNPASPEC